MNVQQWQTDERAQSENLKMLVVAFLSCCSRSGSRNTSSSRLMTPVFSSPFISKSWWTNTEMHKHIRKPVLMWFILFYTYSPGNHVYTLIWRGQNQLMKLFTNSSEGDRTFGRMKCLLVDQTPLLGNVKNTGAVGFVWGTQTSPGTKIASYIMWNENDGPVEPRGARWPFCHAGTQRKEQLHQGRKPWQQELTWECLETQWRSTFSTRLVAARRMMNSLSHDFSELLKPAGETNQQFLQLLAQCNRGGGGGGGLTLGAAVAGGSSGDRKRRCWWHGAARVLPWRHCSKHTNSMSGQNVPSERRDIFVPLNCSELVLPLGGLFTLE